MTASAPDHADTSDDVVVGPVEEVEESDIVLPPPAIELVDVRACEAIAPQGGTCEYSLRVLNNTATALVGTAFSRVIIARSQFDMLPSFEASTRPGDPGVQRAAVVVPPFVGRVATFSSDVPSFLPDGSILCTDVFFGVGGTPLLDVRESVRVFCLKKGTFELELLPEEAPASESFAVDPLREIERNDTCATAQEAGAATIGTALEGRIEDRRSESLTDVDFYRFSAEPGFRFTIEGMSPGAGRRILGFFDEACQLRAISTFDAFNDPLVRDVLDFDVPASGSFLIAVADQSDREFNGDGNLNDADYTFVFTPQTSFVEAITGRLVDARSGRPLRGDLIDTSIRVEGCSGTER